MLPAFRSAGIAGFFPEPAFKQVSQSAPAVMAVPV
jgi:hypothetical protein